MVTVFRRAGRPTWYHRTIIPADLQPLFGRVEITKSLGVTQRGLAVLKARFTAGQLAELFAKLRRRLAKVRRSMSHPGRSSDPERSEEASPDIHALAQQWLTEALEELEERLCAMNGYQEDEAFDLALTDALRSTTVQLMDNDFTQVKEDVAGLLKAHGVGGLPNDLYRRLCREMLKAKQILIREEMQRGEGVYTHTASLTPSTRAVTPTSGKKAPSPTLSQIIPDYLKDFERRSPKTIIAKKATLKRLVSIIGDKPISAISDEDGRRYRETVARLPVNAVKRFKEMPLEQVIQQPGARVSPATINADLKRLTHFFRWCIARPRKYLDENPVEGLRYEGVTEESYDPYTDADLKTLFLSTEFLSEKLHNPPRYYLPLVLCLTGCRREEIASMNVEDVKVENGENGITYFDIVPDLKRERRLKNKASRRVTPIHPALVRLGFLQYVAERVSQGERLVFPRWTGDKVSKWWRRLVKKKGVVGNKTLHSFRATIITRLHEAGVDGETRRQLTGHSGRDVHETVYLRPSLPVLQAAIEKLDFDWLR